MERWWNHADGRKPKNSEKICPKRPDRRWGPLPTYWGSFPSVKRPEREVDHSAASSAKINKGRSYTTTVFRNTLRYYENSTKQV